MLRSSKTSRLLRLFLLCWICLPVLAACGEASPTPRPTLPAPTLQPANPPPAYLAMVDFKFADEAEQAHRRLIAARPDFPAWASWTQSNQWFVLARDDSSERLKERAGPEARVFPVTYLAEANSGQARGAFDAYIFNLNRVTIDVKAGGAKEAARLLFGRAVNQYGLRAGVLIFCLGDDQIYTLLPASTPPEAALALSSLGKLEMVAAGPKAIPDGTVVTTSISPRLGELQLKDSPEYQTLVEPAGFASLQPANGGSSGRPALNFELRSGNRLFEYSRANIGQFAALVFDRQVVSSAQIARAIKDRGEFQVPRWAGPGGQADMQRFVELVNAQPPQIFEAKTVSKGQNFVFSGSFTR